MPRAHQAGFSRRSLDGVGIFESVRSDGPGPALLTNGGGLFDTLVFLTQGYYSPVGVSPHGLRITASLHLMGMIRQSLRLLLL
ncbi:hypothetical protein TNCV_3258851 [Trichonephila clavipes]|nr:hypothetical protein TNCV_3258851 [Trichonephila clavipes]